MCWQTCFAQTSEQIINLFKKMQKCRKCRNAEDWLSAQLCNKRSWAVSVRKMGRPGEVAFLLALFVFLGPLHGTGAQYDDYDNYNFEEDDWEWDFDDDDDVRCFAGWTGEPSNKWSDDVTELPCQLPQRPSREKNHRSCHRQCHQHPLHWLRVGEPWSSWLPRSNRWGRDLVGTFWSSTLCGQW